MIDANALIGALPRMLSGDELMRAMKMMPEYDPGVCDRDEAMRLMKLSDVYDIYLPSAMSVEIYVKPAKPRVGQVSKLKAKKPAEAADVGSAVKGGAKTPDNVSVAEIVADAKNGNRRVVDALREHFSVEEVAV